MTRAWRLVAPAVVVLACSACSTTTDGTGRRSPAAAPTRSAASSPASSSPATSPASSAPPSAPSTSFTSSPPAPQIANATLNVAQSCLAGQSVIPNLSWQVVNATGMALSIDDPTVGSYGTFAAAGSMPLPTIHCTGAAGSTITHTYRLVTVGGTGSPATSTLTIRISVTAPPTRPSSPTPS